jgi:hypothetical protein
MFRKALFRKALFRKALAFIFRGVAGLTLWCHTGGR